jgi:hypothetical protein
LVVLVVVVTMGVSLSSEKYVFFSRWVSCQGLRLRLALQYKSFANRGLQAVILGLLGEKKSSYMIML